MPERVLPKKALFLASGIAALSSIFAPFESKKASAQIPENTPICEDLELPTPCIPSFDFLNIQKNKIEGNWIKLEAPTKVYIPKINYIDDLKPMGIIPKEGGGKTLETPDEGLGTPSKPISEIVFIYGHSRWNKKQNPISQIDKLSRGDEITIESVLGYRRTYLVTDFKLYNYEDPKFTLDDPPNGSLVLQTTARIGGEWLVNEQSVKNDLWPFVPQNISDHAAFQVIATPK